MTSDEHLPAGSPPPPGQNTNSYPSLPPQQDWEQMPQQEMYTTPQQDWEPMPQQDMYPAPQQQDWEQIPQQEMYTTPQQDWEQMPQQDMYTAPQQGWAQADQIIDPETLPYGTSLTGSADLSNRKKINKNLVLVRVIAGILLLAGGIGSYVLYTKGETIRKRTNFLNENIETLSGELTQLRQKCGSVKQTADTIRQTSTETAQLQTSIAAKRKEVQTASQEQASILSKLKPAQQAIVSLRRKLEVKQKQKQPPSRVAVPQPSPGNVPPPVTPLVTDVGNTPQPLLGNNPIPEPSPIPVTPPNTDVQLVEKGMAYLKARKNGDTTTLSAMFAPRCNYLYADGKEVSNQFIMEDIQKFWDKWPKRTYRLLKLAYSGNAMELIYAYECSNHAGKTISGYTKEIWQTSPSGQILQWSEIPTRKAPPDPSPNYRTLKLNY